MRKTLLLAAALWCVSLGAHAVQSVDNIAITPASPVSRQPITINLTLTGAAPGSHCIVQFYSVQPSGRRDLLHTVPVPVGNPVATVTFPAGNYTVFAILPSTPTDPTVTAFRDFTIGSSPGDVEIASINPTSWTEGTAAASIITVTGANLDLVDNIAAANSRPVYVDSSSFISRSSTKIEFSGSLFETGNMVLMFRDALNVNLAIAVVNVVEDDRSDPTQDPDVRGIITAQAAIAERFYHTQSGNINSRLSMLRGAGARENRHNDFNLGVNLPATTRVDRDRRAEERREASPGSIRLGDLARAKGEPALASFPPAAPAAKWSFWSDGAVSFGNLDEDGEADLDHTTFGLTLGLDYAFGDRLVSGFALGYTNDKTDVGSKGSRVKADGYTAALYGSYLVRPNVFLEGMLGYTAIDYDNRRTTGEGLVKGDREGNQYFASLAMGYEYRRNDFALTPFARFETAITKLDAYRESGNRLALKYGKQDIEMYTGSVGMTASRMFALSWAELTPSVGAEYAYNFKDESRVALGYLDTVADMPYSFTAASLARHTFIATGGLDARFRRNFGVGLKYRGSFASERNSHYLGLQAIWTW